MEDVSSKDLNSALKNWVTQFENQVGSFSSYMCIDNIKGQNIEFERKPAQQLLTGLGCIPDKAANLSKTANNEPLNNVEFGDVVVTAFNKPIEDTQEYRLNISAERIKELLDSAKTYVNTAVFPQGGYSKRMSLSLIEAGHKDSDGNYYQNLATQVCHVQKVDLLVGHQVNEKNEAIACPIKGSIEKGAPAILLISAPALNFSYGAADKFDTTMPQYVEGMFRNIFNAAVSEGYHYIALPAAGLGEFEGDPNLYFNALAEVAKQFPSLNIIYHPARFGEKFEEIMKIKNPKNIIRATKDVIYLADELTKNGYPCALHNPSDADVVYGVNDVGQYWKAGKGSDYVGEEHIGAITTAPLNSRLLNPSAYNKIIEVKLDANYNYTAIQKIKMKDESYEKILSNAELVDKFGINLISSNPENDNNITLETFQHVERKGM